MRNTSKYDPPNIALNCETFYEKPLELSSSSVTHAGSDEQPLPQMTGADEMGPDRFTFFSSGIQQARYATRLGDFIADGSNFHDLFDVGLNGGVLWLDVLNPTKQNLTSLH
jgi:hypothetical protein